MKKSTIKRRKRVIATSGIHFSNYGVPSSMADEPASSSSTASAAVPTSPTAASPGPASREVSPSSPTGHSRAYSPCQIIAGACGY